MENPEEHRRKLELLLEIKRTRLEEFLLEFKEFWKNARSTSEGVLCPNCNQLLVGWLFNSQFLHFLMHKHPEVFNPKKEKGEIN